MVRLEAPKLVIAPYSPDMVQPPLNPDGSPIGIKRIIDGVQLHGAGLGHAVLVTGAPVRWDSNGEVHVVAHDGKWVELDGSNSQNAEGIPTNEVMEVLKLISPHLTHQRYTHCIAQIKKLQWQIHFSGMDGSTCVRDSGITSSWFPVMAETESSLCTQWKAAKCALTERERTATMCRSASPIPSNMNWLKRRKVQIKWYREVHRPHTTKTLSTSP
jgi:hypothetical protein